MKNFCILTLLLLFQSLGNVVFAQVEQKGVVLEYNRQKAKKPYLPPVQLLFNTVPAINSGKDGRFRLEFNTAKPGDLVTDYEVKPGDSNFVLFNGRDLHNWALTSKKDMKVEILDSMQGTTLKDIESGVTYLGIMQDNLSVLKEALE